MATKYTIEELFNKDKKIRNIVNESGLLKKSKQDNIISGEEKANRDGKSLVWFHINEFKDFIVKDNSFYVKKKKYEILPSVAASIHISQKCIDKFANKQMMIEKIN